MYNTSFSQADNFESCEMKWYIPKVLKVKEPQNASAELGDHLHKMMENWVVGKSIKEFTSKYPTLGKIYKKNQEWFLKMANLKNIKQEHIEKTLKPVLPCGIMVWAKIDLIEGDNKEIISDYKSRSSFDWCLNEEQLAKDQQLNLYAYYENEERKKKGIKQLITKIRHYNFNTRTFEIQEVTANYNKDIGLAAAHKLNATTIRMLAVEKQEQKFVQKNRASCGKYGGCAFLEFCNKKQTLKELKDHLAGIATVKSSDDDSTPEEKLNELKKELGKGSKMGFNDRLKGKRQEQDEQVTNFKKKGGKHPVEETDDDDEIEEIEDEENEDEVETPKPKGKGGFGNRSRTSKVEDDSEDEPEEKPKKKNKKVDEDEVDEDALDEIENNVDEVEETDEPEEKPKGKKTGNINTMKTLVFVGCMPSGEEVIQPSIFLKKKYIDPILKKDKISMLCESKFNESAKKLLWYADEIKNEFFGKQFIYIDTMRVADQVVLDMLLEDDTGRFIIVRKVF